MPGSEKTASCACAEDDASACTSVGAHVMRRGSILTGPSLLRQYMLLEGTPMFNPVPLGNIMDRPNVAAHRTLICRNFPAADVENPDVISCTRPGHVVEGKHPHSNLACHRI